MENQENNNGQLQIELKEEVAQGTYANLAIITHSSSEFILDFIRVMPGMPKAGVQSRIVFGTRTCQAFAACTRREYWEIRTLFRTDSHAGRTNISASSQHQG